MDEPEYTYEEYRSDNQKFGRAARLTRDTHKAMAVITSLELAQPTQHPHITTELYNNIINELIKLHGELLTKMKNDERFQTCQEAKAKAELESRLTLKSRPPTDSQESDFVPCSGCGVVKVERGSFVCTTCRP